MPPMTASAFEHPLDGDVSVLRGHAAQIEFVFGRGLITHQIAYLFVAE